MLHVERSIGGDQASPGPHPSLAGPGVVMPGLGPRHIAAGLALLLAAAGQYTASTLSVGKLTAPVAGVGAAVLGGLALLVIEWSPFDAVRSLGSRAILLGLSGFLALGAVPWIVLGARHSDAPAGSVVAFWTTVFWGLILAAAPAASISSWFRKTAGALLALTGAFGVLGNWERPSSFSLLTRFPGEQLTMAAAGVLWVGSVLVLAYAARLHGSRPVLAAAGLGAMAGGIVAALATWSEMSVALLGSATMLLLALSTALVLVLTVTLTAKVGVGLPAASLLLVPTVMSSLTIVEAATASFGPRPLLAVPVVAGSILAVAGVATMLEGERARGDGAGRAPGLATSLALTAVAFVAVALVFPGVHATVRAVPGTGEEFSASFNLAGFETTGGWIALATAALAVSWSTGRHMTSRRQSIILASVATIAALTWYILRFTPLHTWMTWIPPEVQQDYGTEYAGILFSGVPVTWQAIAIGTAVAALLVAAVAPMRSESKRVASEEDVR